MRYLDLLKMLVINIIEVLNSQNVLAFGRNSAISAETVPLSSFEVLTNCHKFIGFAVQYSVEISSAVRYSFEFALEILMLCSTTSSASRVLTKNIP